MGAGHSHGPAAGQAGGRHRWRLAVSFGLIAVFFIVELTYGLISGCLALLADAGHMAADVVALGATRHTSAPATSYRSGRNPSNTMAPGQGPGHEHAVVRGQDAPEVRIRLQRGDEAVQPQSDDPRAHPQPAPVLAHALPDQPRPTNLSKRRQTEQGYRLRDQHGLGLPAGPRNAARTLRRSTGAAGPRRAQFQLDRSHAVRGGAGSLTRA
jgi:hypothetical protein